MCNTHILGHYCNIKHQQPQLNTDASVEVKKVKKENEL